ncbi:segregation and condensation protein A [Anaerobranca gottschalkii]|uniref:Segregation and condensation protein A n=1 Tax=Anaerobranca gottschalkii DSM 13577 TaxID=1120990 RepID=A0A1H9Y0J3_9FIRM|nr:segregation/condensation protein A [Anaerobranca gottschalkii]SES62243.1 condensin subunit ScpA [Anaerobranca gottschalkii DSM 13577]
MEFNVKTANFEGPFDLLLHLVEKAQVDINEISIAQITEDFLKAIQEMERLDLDVASEFLVVAATLIDIKSKTLLPFKKGNGDKGDFLEDPRQQLVRRLLEYKKYKEVSKVMLEMANNAEHFHTRLPSEIEPQSRPLNLSLHHLFRAFQRAMDKAKILNEKEEKVHQIVKEEITIGEQMEYIMELLKTSPKLYFGELLKNWSSKYYLVISFLAVLELIRLKKIYVVQGEPFGDIEISLRREDVGNGGQ